jgi:hypothetical protein
MVLRVVPAAAGHALGERDSETAIEGDIDRLLDAAETACWVPQKPGSTNEPEKWQLMT